MPQRQVQRLKPLQICAAASVQTGPEGFPDVWQIGGPGEAGEVPEVRQPGAGRRIV